MKLPLAAMIQLGFVGFALASPTLDTEKTVNLSICSDLSQRWDCYACGNCCIKT